MSDSDSDSDLEPEYNYIPPFPTHEEHRNNGGPYIRYVVILFP
jgi:hypothetical protein